MQVRLQLQHNIGLQVAGQAERQLEQPGEPSDPPTPPMGSTSAISARAEEGAGLRAHIPIRVHTSQTSWRQMPFPPKKCDGAETRLGDVLCSVLPSLFPCGGGAQTETDAPGGAVSGAILPPATAVPRVLVQGVQVPLQTSVAYLSEACAHPDGFVYVSCTRLPN